MYIYGNLYSRGICINFIRICICTRPVVISRVLSGRNRHQLSRQLGYIMCQALLIARQDNIH